MFSSKTSKITISLGYGIDCDYGNLPPSFPALDLDGAESGGLKRLAVAGVPKATRSSRCKREDDCNTWDAAGTVLFGKKNGENLFKSLGKCLFCVLILDKLIQTNS